jgi:3-hydroxymyristoyl/3-hydroxydecanoyl-(acyl carrier protein) dehydratase
MMPVADFDDPDALAARFALLRDGGAAPGRFKGIVPPRVVRERGVAGESAAGTLQVPAAAPFFNDHFPKRPVFPATLLLDAQIDLALQVAAESSNWPVATQLTPVRMTNVKVRSFTPPGQTLTLAAQMQPPKGDVATFMLSAEADGKTVATARVDIAPGKDAS